MKLNKLEYLAMNNPARRLFQKNIEFSLFKKFLNENKIDLNGKIILDAGCGSGYSTELIIKQFNPSKIVAFDFMPEQIALAKKRSLNAEFFVGNITKTGLPSDHFDAVFIFGVLHHVKDWAKGLDETARVLKPGGALLVEELGKFATLSSNFFGFSHPKENRFNLKEFEEAMIRTGFDIKNKKLLMTGIKSYLCKKL